jgi:PAS domain S-box-containing protein
MALPALWAGGGLQSIADTLMDALAGILRPTFVFLRLNRAYWPSSKEMARVAVCLRGMEDAETIGTVLDSMLSDQLRIWPSRASFSVEGADLVLTSARLGVDGELGIVVVASHRADFPQETEKLILDVAANQAAIALQQEHKLIEHESVAKELDERVAERTRELAFANEQLKKSEHELKLIIDSIPGLIELLSPAGEIELANSQVAQYFGQTIEQLRHWASNDTVHPEDLAHVVHVFSRSIATGSPYEIVQRFKRSDGVYRWFQNTGHPLHDASGRIVRWYALLTDIDDRKRAEDAVRASERDLKEIIDAIPTFVWCMLPDGSNEFISKSWHEYTGVTPEEARGWGWQSAFHPDDLSTLMKKWMEVLIAGEADELEARIRRRDGVYRWFLIRAQPFRDESGNLIRWYGTSTDIEDRKRAENALESRGQNLKLIIDTIPTLSWSTEADGYVEFLSRPWLDFTGLTAEEAHGFGWSAAIHPDDAPGLLRYWQAALDAGTQVDVEARMRRFDGVYRWFLFRANPLRDENGSIVKWYGTNVDIEDRKKAAEELRRKEEFLTRAHFLTLSGCFSWCVDADEVTFSEGARRIYGFEVDTPVTLERIATYIHPDDHSIFVEKIEAARTSGGDQEYGFRLQMPDGSIKYLRASSQETRDTRGRREYVGAIQDVTARYLAEQALDKARSDLAHVARVTSLSALTASIAHEINQPLSGITTNAGTCLLMLNSDPPNVDGARETVRRTIRDSSRASDIISRLRALFGKGSFTVEQFDLNEATREVIVLSSNDLKRNQVIVQAELSDNPQGVKVTGDRIQIQQVILNLLRNASDAMAEIHDRPRRLVIRTKGPENGFVSLSVQDYGVGFLGQSVEKLFDSFYTTKSDGMGIGLSISRSIIERHGGRLWAEANDGPGVTFSFEIRCDSNRESKSAPLGNTS